jgi:hypothetical protein
MSDPTESSEATALTTRLEVFADRTPAVDVVLTGLVEDISI